ncbi:guanine nucleotide exchange factor VAV3b isoform X1 [Pygocentrus nattereri]|uniref:guanine nucleotide exchange factor VAV3b isoform X1 n=1 Tax=Pygocentrus nattereri TaxID=42514 RepID=UPI001891978F|nr:guanine nucleotide exchange factor VAV3b isoform X1 [Pygocentrus nattereri]
MEYWRQCSVWLIDCRVLPPTHRVRTDWAQVFDLAQTLRDGVLLCQLLNNLRANTINLKEINLRPQMSQFLCLKNIRTFLSSCCEAFGMKKSELFDAFDLFDVRDFGKVIDTLSKLSHTPAALQSGIRPFPTEESVENEDIYIHLADLIDEQVLEDIYDPVYGDVEGGEIYEDLMRTEAAAQTQKQAEVDVRSCCLSEINQTEEKYTETLESIEKYFLIPLKKFMSTAELDKVFINIPDLVRAHQSLMMDIKESIQNKNASNLHQIFTNYKDRLLIYGIYCSQVETAIAMLDFLCKEKQDIRLKLEECSKRANNGKFTLRDLLVVPMQRVLKYPLLLQELVKHTPDSSEKNNLRTALDAMRDLAQYVNEVKRDNETLREIDQYQRSIENLNQCLLRYGRPKGDGEVRLATNVDKRRQDRHIFLFDAAVIVCKRRGDNYEMKDVIDLSLYKITNNPTTDKDCRKWCYGFYLTHEQGTSGFEFFFKTKELKKKWLDQFQMALSNIRPENATYNSHHFRMHTFEWVTTCSSCHMLLRGIFNQGYLCPKCGVGAHKECLGRLGACGRADPLMSKPPREITQRKRYDPGLPRMLVIRDYLGAPSPPGGPPLSVQVGDVIEVISANLDSCWWQGKIPTTREVGFFPSDAVRPCPCVPRPVDYSSQLWFAGLMERHHAEAALMERENSTYLIRHRSRECSEYAISIKYNNEVKHIKILTRDGCFYIAESRTFKTVQGLVEYYKHHSLREGFRSLDTTLKVPYRALGRDCIHTANTTTAPVLCGFTALSPSNTGFIPPSTSPFWSVFCPRVVGIALARYDFSSRDTRELSLHVGDLVKIYTKCANGWWRGEVNSRVGWFPSTYVEEEE